MEDDNTKQGIKITITEKQLIIDATDADVLTGTFDWKRIDELREEVSTGSVLHYLP
jgi:hypothetical protein